jgi:NADPH:quinone reductase-like Zn-dependent oxidoreductase
MTQTMQAVIASTPGGAGALTQAFRPVPAPERNAMLIRVAAVGASRTTSHNKPRTCPINDP